MAHLLAALYDPHIRALLAEILQEEGYEVTVPREVWGGLGVARSVLHGLIVIYQRDGSPGLLTDEHLAAIEANMEALKRHEYIQLTWRTGLWPPRFQRLVDQMHIQAIPGTFDIKRDLLPAVERAAARLTARGA